MFLRNVGVDLQHNAMSKLRKLKLNLNNLCCKNVECVINIIFINVNIVNHERLSFLIIVPR
jgi:hypothetical protein